MTKAAYPLKVLSSMKTAAERLAKEDGVLLNQWISAAIAQKIGAVETAADFLINRPGTARAMARLLLAVRKHRYVEPIECRNG